VFVIYLSPRSQGSAGIGNSAAPNPLCAVVMLLGHISAKSMTGGRTPEMRARQS
jgi:hypothetical protein